MAIPGRRATGSRRSTGAAWPIPSATASSVSSAIAPPGTSSVSSAPASGTRSSTSPRSRRRTPRRAALALQGRVGHYVMISTGQVYLVREPRPRNAAREADYDGPVMRRARRPRRTRGMGLRHGQARGRGRAPGGLGRSPVPGDPTPHPHGERRARLPPADRRLPVAAPRRRSRPPARRRPDPHPPRLQRRRGPSHRAHPRQSRHVRAGLQPRAGRDADPGRDRWPSSRRSWAPRRASSRCRPDGSWAPASTWFGSRLSAVAGCRSSIRRGPRPSSASATSPCATTSTRSWPRSWPTRRPRPPRAIRRCEPGEVDLARSLTPA